MPQLNDAMYAALRTQLYTGAVNDMLVQWLLDGGATGSDLNDLWRSYFLQELGITTGNLVDQDGGEGGTADKGAFKVPDILGSELITTQCNRDFSCETLQNWTFNGSGSLTYDTTVDIFDDDKHAKLLSDAGGNCRALLRATVFPVSANTLVRAEVELYMPVGNTSFDVQLTWSDTPDPISETSVTLLPGVRTIVSTYIYVIADTDFYLIVGFKGTPTSGDICYFDNSSIKTVDISWVPYSDTRLSLDETVNALVVAGVSVSQAAFIYLADSSDLIENLVIGESYELLFTAKVSAGATVTVVAQNAGNVLDTTGNIAEVFTLYKLKFTAVSTTLDTLRVKGMAADDQLWIKELSLSRDDSLAFNDLAIAFLELEGFTTGSLNDRWHAFWSAGG